MLDNPKKSEVELGQGTSSGIFRSSLGWFWPLVVRWRPQWFGLQHSYVSQGSTLRIPEPGCVLQFSLTQKVVGLQHWELLDKAKPWLIWVPGSDGSHLKWHLANHSLQRYGSHCTEVTHNQRIKHRLPLPFSALRHVSSLSPWAPFFPSNPSWVPEIHLFLFFPELLFSSVYLLNLGKVELLLLTAFSSSPRSTFFFP